MAWADRATVILGLFWALAAFVLMGGTQRPDLTLFSYLQIFALFWGIPLAIAWVALRLVMGNRGSLH